MDSKKLNKFSVSVIIPVYNAERFLEKAVESCLVQKEVKEVLLIEDKSTDNSLSLCENLENKYEIVKLFQHPDKGNHNAAATRNLGIIKSNYEYIAFLDADDFYLPNRFVKSKEILINNLSVDGVYEAIGSYAYDEKGGELQKQRMDQMNIPQLNGMTTMIEVINPKDLFEELLIGRKGWFHFNGLTLRKSTINIVGYINESLQRFGEDTEFFLRLSLKANLVGGNIIKPVALRGVYEGNTTLEMISTSNYDKTLVRFNKILSEILFNWMLENKFKRKINIIIIRRYLESIAIGRKYKKPFKFFYLLKLIFLKPSIIIKLTLQLT